MNNQVGKAFMCFITAAMIWEGFMVPVQAGTNKEHPQGFHYSTYRREEKIQAPLWGSLPWTRQGDVYYSIDGSVIPGAYARGIDVSSNNGNIDWNAVKNDGVDFAIIRCGYGENRPDQDDRQWEANIQGAAAAGIPYGTYLYSYADTEQKAVSEAEHVLRLLNGRPLSYPVYLDMEDQTVFLNTTAQQREQIAESFCRRIEAAGYKAAIYSSVSSFTNLLPEGTFDKWNRWVAHYNPQCGYKGTYHMWQATNQGRVAGVNGNVDINFLISEQLFIKPEIKLSSPGKKTAKISWKPKKKGTFCHIYYSRRKNGGYKQIRKNAKKGFVKIKKLKSGKKYYFKVRTSKTMNGVTVYSKFSKVKKITIR